MPEHLMSHTERVSVTPPKMVSLGGSTFWQRREDIFKRIQRSAEQCRLNYSGRRELATENDDNVAELCEALEDAFTYGLRQQNSVVAITAASIFQNMQEIVTGSSSAVNDTSGDVTFWDFCQIHLTPHERDRYVELKKVWTKCGRGKAFIRATLNENSLRRYILTWLSAEEELRRFYSPWSLLMDATASKELPNIIGSLQHVLFALTVDATELNAPTRHTPLVPNKEEPVIYAPTPVPAINTKHKRKLNPVERPIATANSTEDLINAIKEVSLAERPTITEILQSNLEYAAHIDHTPPDPIEPELAFLNEPLPDFYPNTQLLPCVAKNITIAANGDELAALNGIERVQQHEHEYEDKSDTSSQYSKSSSANCSANQTALEEKLREMEERCTLLETRVAQLSRENRQLVRRLTQNFNGLAIDPSASLATNFLITIPTAQLLKTKHGSSYYAYEIHITMRQNLEHWSLLRRYRDFHKLHKSLLRTHPSVAAVEFPPKKHFGNMNLVFVEERRQQLQIYLLNVVELLPPVEACKSKVELQRVFPFLRER